MRPAKYQHSKRVIEVTHRIKELRKEQGYSQEQFAAMIDIDRSHYSSIERGKVNISLHTLFTIAEVLHLPMKEFFVNDPFDKKR